MMAILDYICVFDIRCFFHSSNEDEWICMQEKMKDVFVQQPRDCSWKKVKIGMKKELPTSL